MRGSEGRTQPPEAKGDWRKPPAAGGCGKLPAADGWAKPSATADNRGLGADPPALGNFYNCLAKIKHF